MRLVSVRAADATSAGVVSRVEEVFARCFTLADLLAHTAQWVPRIHVSEIVTQDEYTHDVVLPFEAPTS